MEKIRTVVNRGILNCIIILMIIAIHFFAFRDTLFNGVSISKITSLHRIDSLYNSDLHDWQIRAPFDPCVYIFQQPIAFQVIRTISQNAWPHWNPNASAGQPILANIESEVFNPLKYLFPATSERLYNLGIVAKVILAGIGVFAASRVIGLSLWAGFLAAITYTFCPFFLREIELTTETWSYPWILACFAWFGENVKLRRAAILGLVCGVVCACIHPLSSFNVIVLGTFHSLLMHICNRAAKSKADFKDILRFSGFLAIAGIIALCICAPVLFPFCEFLTVASSHKLDGFSLHNVPFRSLVCCLLVPLLGGNTPFLGVFSLPVILGSGFLCRPINWPIYISLLLAMLVCTLLGPLSIVFSRFPLNVLEPIYVLGWFLLLSSVLFAHNVERFLLFKSDWKLVAFILVAAIISCVLPNLLASSPTLLREMAWDGGMEPMSINWNSNRRDIVLTICICIAVASIKLCNKPKLLGWLFPLLLVFGNFFTEAFIAKNALPAQAHFNYPETPVVAYLKCHLHQRFIATGRHFFWPNISSVWNLPDFRSFNSMYPQGFLRFLNICGARKYFATHYRFEDSLGPALDLASVSKIISRGAVWDRKFEQDILSHSQKRVAYFKDYDLKSASLLLNNSSSAVFAGCSIDGNLKSISDLAYQCVVLDSQDRFVWIGDSFKLSNYFRNGKCRFLASWCVPPGIAVRKLDGLKFCLRLSQAFSREPQFPTSVLHGQVRDSVVMQRGCNSSANSVVNSDRFHLEKLFSDGVRLYSSRSSKPQSYVVTNFSIVNSHGQAFELVEKYSDYNVDRTVIEDYWGSLKPKAGYFRTVQLTRPSPNEVSIVAPGPGFLILTDSFYPGWKCTVNGKESTIFRANGYFRAVEIGNGQNNVVFRFQPLSFTIGLWVCATILFVMSNWILLCLAQKVKRTYSGIL